MKIDEHEKAYKEHLSNIKRAIEEGINENLKISNNLKEQY